MPRSSRSKSHKQSKHSSREYSDIEEDVKMKERNDNNDGKINGVSVKVSKDSVVSGEKRKDLDCSHANGSVCEEYATPSKRRREKIHGGSDRWNGDGGDEKSEVVNVEEKKLKSKDLVKVVGESKSKSSRKHDVESASVVVVEKDGSKIGSGSRSEKRSDRESVRKEGRQIKENKESKDKDRGSERERERKIHDSKREVEVLLKQADNQPSKRAREHNEWPIEEELRNIELEKELEKRMRRREGYSDKDRYQDDVKDVISTKSGHAKDSKHREEVYKDKYREGSARETRPKEDKYKNNGEPVSKSRDVKYRGECEKDSKNKDDKYKCREDDNREVRNKDGKNHEKHREERYQEDVERDHRHKNGRSRDDTDREKRARDHKHREVETKNVKDDMDAAELSQGQKGKRGESPIYGDRVARHKDGKDRRRDNDKDERSVNDAKVDRTPERGRSSSRNDMEIAGNRSRHRSSSSSRFYSTRDHHRVSKQEETKHRDSVHEERASHNRYFTSASGQSDKTSSRSLEKITQKDDNCIDGSSMIQRNLDVDELGSGSKDAKEYSDKDSKVNDHSHMDGDNLSVSSPYGKNGHFSSNHKSLQPLQPVFRTGSRPQNNWKNIPNWPSPLANGGYIPFQHIPPPIFNPVMQQFVPPIFGRPPMQMNHSGMPYHIDGDRFSGHGHSLWRNQVEESISPSLSGWEMNNVGFSDGSHGYGRTQLNNQMWESSADLWKGQESHKVDHLVKRPTDEIWSEQTGQHVENEHSQPENVPENNPEVIKVSESPRVSVVAKEDDSFIPRVYLSKIDISEDLTEPELYEQCRNMLDLDQALVSDEFNCKILFLEAKEGIEADISNGASLFAAIDDSIYKKAMSIYTKHKVPLVAMNKSVSSSDQENEKNEAVIQKVDMKEDKCDEQISTLEKMDMEVEVEDKDSWVKKADNLLCLSNNNNNNVVGELIEFGSVNISRIHDDESTH